MSKLEHKFNAFYQSSTIIKQGVYFFIPCFLLSVKDDKNLINYDDGL
ncbi:hypothetical protein H6G11_07415 [Cyanobacterium aponinum FACHB-4101]|nr:hypothetical protein [Cyanobacterium aponinum]MBD2394084.1 hypothetical protein [Cyanobacterium aponinum FACHB-4101]